MLCLNMVKHILPVVLAFPLLPGLQVYQSDPYIRIAENTAHENVKRTYINK